MFKKVIALFIICTFLFTGCFTMTHKVGNGAQGSTSTEERQWYILFGLVPINNVDSKAMAGGAADYTVVTQATVVDVIIGAFTGIVSVQPMTVKVTK
jgi:Bor protein